MGKDKKGKKVMFNKRYTLSDLPVIEPPTKEEFERLIKEYDENIAKDPDYYKRHYSKKSTEEEMDECIQKGQVPIMTPGVYEVYRERMKVWQKEHGLL